jgi:hypothetical protein
MAAREPHVHPRASRRMPVAARATEKVVHELDRPERTLLYEVVRDNLETLYAAIVDGDLDVGCRSTLSRKPEPMMGEPTTFAPSRSVSNSDRTVDMAEPDAPIPPFQRIDSRTLPPSYIERLRDRIGKHGAKRSALNSEGLGCIAVLIIGTLFLVGLSVGRFRKGPLWQGIAVGIAALVVGYLVYEMIRNRRSSPLPEFTLTTHAYHLRSIGDGFVEAYCMPLCSRIRYTNHFRNGIYEATTMKMEFGGDTLVLTDDVDAKDRAAPWERCQQFMLFEGVIALAKQAASTGGWHSLSGADLLPGSFAAAAPAAPREIE